MQRCGLKAGRSDQESRVSRPPPFRHSGGPVQFSGSTERQVHPSVSHAPWCLADCLIVVLAAPGPLLSPPGTGPHRKWPWRPSQLESSVLRGHTAPFKCPGEGRGVADTNVLISRAPAACPRRCSRCEVAVERHCALPQPARRPPPLLPAGGSARRRPLLPSPRLSRPASPAPCRTRSDAVLRVLVSTDNHLVSQGKGLPRTPLLPA